MNKRMKMMLLCAGTLFGGIFLYKIIGGFLFARMMASGGEPPSTVSAMKVTYSSWQPQISAVASLRAMQGVNVTSEVTGMVNKIYFIPGVKVKEGTVLVQLNANADVAQLQSLIANANLSKITYTRDKAQYAAHAISKQTLDSDEANLKNNQALVDQQAATVLKKTIRAPFTGRLGISAVNPGQFINPGDKIVTLQNLDPIYADFYVPQQTLVQLKVGQAVQMTLDAFPGKVFPGMITAIDPIIEVTTRNVQVEATIANPDDELVPGMFSTITVRTGMPQRYLTLPQTAVSFNPYGDIVYVVNEGKVTQSFVTLGETRGDQVTVLKGLKEGDTVVTSGQIKLRNGSPVVINNSVVPENNPAPKAENEK